MAPPKRKTTGRVTPKGTRPGQTPLAAHLHHDSNDVSSSSRYTPPTSKYVNESPRWVPVLMLTLIGIAVVLIILRYIVWTGSNMPVLAGLVFLLAGLYVATKWK
ncbi:MAG: cell division protein CrgA [Ilumatobacteraceae bacterium]